MQDNSNANNMLPREKERFSVLFVLINAKVELKIEYKNGYKFPLEVLLEDRAR